MGLNLGSGALDALDVRLGSVTPPAVYHGSVLVWPLVAGGGGGGLESIATITVGAGGASSIEFVDIPQTFAHLQVRGIFRADGTGGPGLSARLNSDTGDNYARHGLSGDGASASAFGVGADNFMSVGGMPTTSQTAGKFSALVLDILDYASTSKKTTVRSLCGQDYDGSGDIMLRSGLWMSTAAVSSITFLDTSGRNFVQYSQAALYGIGEVV